ncbi:MAG: peptide-methionine (S)-S-oxide reductase MsrA, partial [Pseudomonadota bacterium]|nr:peptide-methionine (S)-S-oxide reductase MsrA [Pseudomonadota bacterium]
MKIEMKLRRLAGIMLTATIAISPLQADEERPEVATFAGGCFWCMEGPFDRIDGVVETVSGYTGGQVRNPTYRQVSAGGTGHAEAVQVTYDPDKVSYRELLEVFWRNIDPTVKDRQFCDSGSQYRSAIYYHSAEQRAFAERSRQEVPETVLGERKIYTEIVAASTFYPAEEYHQDYYIKNPVRYKYYRYSCGRDQRLEELWG